MSKKAGSRKSVEGDNIQISIGDHVSHVSAGKNIQHVVNERAQYQISEADLAAIRDLFSDLKRHIEAQAPPEKVGSAIERVDELEGAVTADKPDLTTIEYVKRWFVENLPQLAASVVGVLVNPIVGRVVEVAGELAAGEFKRWLDKH